MNRIATYRFPPDFEIVVLEGDALSVAADVGIFGRSHAIRERLSVKPAEDLPTRLGSRANRRKVAVFDGGSSAWKAGVSLDYRPRCVSNPPRRQGPYWPRKLPHVAGLCCDVEETLVRVDWDLAAGTVVFVPFSWRNPQVVAIAIVGAIWKYCYSFATRLGAIEEPQEPFLDGLESLFLSFLPQPAEGWAEAKRKGLIAVRSAIEQQGYIRRFICTDLSNAEPFVTALTNKDQVLLKTLPELDAASWEKAPFVQTREPRAGP